MTLWIFYESWWVLPTFGGIVGGATNWLALKMIFSPVNPVKCGCCCTLHGLFLRRQTEVAAEYARTVSREVLNPKNILAAMLSGPLSSKLHDVVRKHIQPAMDQFAGVSKTLIKLTRGADEYNHMMAGVMDNILAGLPKCLAQLEEYAEEALDMESTLREKMAALPSKDFEGLLHPVFQKDESKLIAAGVALGVVIGVIQIFTLQ
jgi:uncharacterized membrane protein YheB (UPF0754 family)